ncbi:hypothetical protein [Kitasatospora sp. NPDC058478]|uniref:hypothetical protein n=1 Tax=unclassified Kitasatospora TaxID=2633591 RepID=UPI0036520E23
MTEETGDRTPPALAPLDEAYVAYADAMSRLIHDGLTDFPLPFVRDHGHYLSTALHLRYLADVLVEKAVIVENERGASWNDIGEAAHISKQTAHQKWAGVVRVWTAFGRRRERGRSSAAVARELDTWYAELVPETEFAVTAGLAATDPRNEVEQRAADTDRADARRLHKHLDELRDQDTAAYNDTMAALDPAERARARERWAAARTAMAETYDQLARLEPTIADDHHARARQQRELATEIGTPSTGAADTAGR